MNETTGFSLAPRQDPADDDLTCLYMDFCCDIGLPFPETLGEALRQMLIAVHCWWPGRHGEPPNARLRNGRSSLLFLGEVCFIGLFNFRSSRMMSVTARGTYPWLVVPYSCPIQNALRLSRIRYHDAACSAPPTLYDKVGHEMQYDYIKPLPYLPAHDGTPHSPTIRAVQPEQFTCQ